MGDKNKMRLLFYILLSVAIYYLLRSIFKPKPAIKKKVSNNTWQIEDELVKDPVCGVYIPRKKAISVKIKGKIYYFCSEECKEKYKKQLEGEK